MSSAGSRLHEARVAAGISLEQIARRTKIQVWMLEAIERDDFERLPRGVFARGFLSAFAREVGLDPDVVLADYVASVQPEPQPVKSVPRVEPAAADVVAPRGRVLSALSATAIVCAALAALFWLNLPSRQSMASALNAVTTAARDDGAVSTTGSREPTPPGEQAVATTAGGELTSPSEQVGSTTGGNEPKSPGEQVASTAGGNETTQPETSTSDSPAAPPAAINSDSTRADGLTLDIQVLKSLWLEASTDGQSQIYRLLNPGDREHLQAQHEISLRLGDASALEYSINGAPGRPLGGPGEIRNIRITPDNFRSFLPAGQPPEVHSDGR